MGTIVLSAGHYPQAQGAAFGDLTEHAEAIRWVNKIADGLSSRRAPWLIIEPGPLTKKLARVNSIKDALVAVEVHFNSAPGRVGRGCETLYMPNSERGRKLAQALQGAMSSFCTPNRGIKEGWYRMDRPGHIDYVGDVDGDEKVDAWLAKTHCPAAIIEPLFIYEVARLEELRDVVCDSLAAALVEYVKE